MTPETRFWSKVKKGECWEWQAARTPLGYGVFGVTPTDTRAAHRYAYEITNGPIPDGMVVMHSCDNPPCVRPSHLSVGTQTDNMGDAARKGRTARGEGHGRHRLTLDEVVAIRNQRAAGYSLALIAAAFEISQAEVSLIARGLKWPDAGGPLTAKDRRWS